MLIYPVLHFIYPVFVASIIPPWIPWHRFGSYFTALTIAAAGVSIVTKKHARMAGILLGIEIMLFCLLIHVPLLLHRPGDAWAARAMFGDTPSRVINAFKDFGLSGAVFVFAGIQSEQWKRTGRDAFLGLGKAILLISIAAFGILHFVFPAFAPGIPPMFVNVRFPLPGHLFWICATGIALLLFSAMLALNWRTRNLAVILGLMILAFDLLTWSPDFLVHPMDLAGNWLKDLGIVGGIFALAALPASESLNPSRTRCRP